MFITAFAIIALATCPTLETTRPGGSLQKPPPAMSVSPPRPLRPRTLPASRNPRARQHRDDRDRTDREHHRLDGNDVYETDLYGSDLYSRHARRRMTAFLRLRILEMRKAGLDRAADVVEHRLCPDALLSP